MPKTAAISARIAPAVKAAAEKAAAADGRSLANWVERALVRALVEQGYLKK
jgi:predicted HicB family RNase H-like nuclease